MRFARHARIFHGPLDIAPVASVVLLLMMFMMLGSLVYTPGVLIGLGQTITVTQTNTITFGDKTYEAGEMDRLRADLRSLRGDAVFGVAMEPGANPALGQQVSNLFQITLPDGHNLVGTDNATMVVAVNFLGQYFYQNRLVQDAELKAELASQIKLAAGNSKKLTMILLVDKAAEFKVLSRLYALAGEAGLGETIMAERPDVFGAHP
jgi:biopolymer transport protein ExbD